MMSNFIDSINCIIRDIQRLSGTLIRVPINATYFLVFIKRKPIITFFQL